MLSKSSKYGMKAVLCLSIHSNEYNKLSPKSIADKIDIPEAYLSTILKQLSKRGLISSKRGRNGGFYLTKENANQPLLEIIDCIDGIDKIDSCMMGLAICDNENPCPVHHLYHPFKQRLLKELKNKSIHDFGMDVENGKTHLI